MITSFLLKLFGSQTLMTYMSLALLNTTVALAQEEANKNIILRTVEDVRENDPEFLAFKEGVYPYAIQNCKTCHGVEGKSKKPQFARSDEARTFTVIAQAFLAARYYIKFSDLKSSIFYMQATNGHCEKPFCKKDGKELFQAMLKWRVAYFQKLGQEVEPDPSEVMELNPQKISVDTSAAEEETAKKTQKRFTWKLPDGESEFSIKVQIHENNLLIFSSPELMAKRGIRYRVAGVSFKVNEKIPLLANYSQISLTTVNEGLFAVGVANDRLRTKLSTDIEVIPLDNIELSTLALTPQFRVLEKLTADKENTACQALDKFVSDILPSIEARDCRNCHQAIDLSKPEKLCAEMLSYLHSAEPARSPIIHLVMGKGDRSRAHNTHPKVIADPTEIFPYWLNWIEAETSSASKEGSK